MTPMASKFVFSPVIQTTGPKPLKRLEGRCLVSRFLETAYVWAIFQKEEVRGLFGHWIDSRGGSNIQAKKRSTRNDLHWWSELWTVDTHKYFQVSLLASRILLVVSFVNKLGVRRLSGLES